VKLPEDPEMEVGGAAGFAVTARLVLLLWLTILVIQPVVSVSPLA
jgi:hypothetical protein